jgi:hypothetical protein
MSQQRLMDGMTHRKIVIPGLSFYFSLSLLLAVDRTVTLCPVGLLSGLILLIDGELMFEDAAKVWATLGWKSSRNLP